MYMYLRLKQIPHVARISALLVKTFGVLFSVSAGKSFSIHRCAVDIDVCEICNL